MMTSTSPMPSERAASSTWEKSASPACLSSIGSPHLDLAEARRTGAVTGAHDLFRLSLAAIGDAPQRPVIPAGNGGAGVPELGRDAAIAGIFEHADALPVPELPSD